MDTKKCSSCKEVKDISNFSKDSRRKDKLFISCKQCVAKISRKSYLKNKEKVIKRNKERRENTTKEYRENENLNKKYGITREDRLKMLSDQNHKCDICGVDEVNAIRNKLFVDHNHTNGKVRSLLCHNCNVLIGHCKESEDILLKAIQYLRKHKD